MIFDQQYTLYVLIKKGYIAGRNSYNIQKQK